jgi:hypothetical protein
LLSALADIGVRPDHIAPEETSTGDALARALAARREGEEVQ